MYAEESERFEATDYHDFVDDVKLKFYGRGHGPALFGANERLLTFTKIKDQGHNTRNAKGRSLTYAKITALFRLFQRKGIPKKPITLLEETVLLGQVSDDIKQRAKDAFNETIGQWKQEDFIKWINQYEMRDAALENNHDHCLPYAIVVYEVFHVLALEEASKARKRQLTPDQKNERLEYAYALEAYGSHYLVDAIHRGGMPANFRNSANFRFAQHAIQIGADEVFEASKEELPEMNITDSKVFDLIPDVHLMSASMSQIGPEGGIVRRRKKV